MKGEEELRETFARMSAYSIEHLLVVSPIVAKSDHCNRSQVADQNEGLLEHCLDRDFHDQSPQKIVRKIGMKRVVLQKLITKMTMKAFSCSLLIVTKHLV
jgi:hypothetical protein